MVGLLWRTHVLGGAATGYLVSDSSTALTAMAVGGVAALLPDIDSPYSHIGNRFLPAAWIFKLTVGHRGFFHSALAALIAASLAYLFPPVFLTQSVMFCTRFQLGLISHSSAPEGYLKRF